MRSPLTKLGLSFAFFLLLPFTAQAGLTWERAEVELQPDPKTDVAQAVVGFKNNGNQALTILEVKPSCSCTTTSLDKKTYQPGEAGLLRLTVDLANASGTVTKSVQIFCDDAPAQPTTLTLHATLPEPLIIATQEVVWAVGEAETTKEILVTINPSRPDTQITAVRSNAIHFTASLKRDPADGRQFLVVKPRSNAAAAHEVIFIDSKSSEAGPLRTTIVTARIR